MAGTVNVSRDLWDDPTFKDSEMSQREAWVWMIAEAAWKAHARRFGSHEISLQRGQLAASTRFMAKAWMWSEARVRRYLDMLENRRMIQRETDAGVTVVTICKYDDYQGGRKNTDAPATQQPTQQRRTTDAKEKKGEIREEDKKDANASMAGPTFDQFWSSWPLTKQGKDSARRAFAKLSVQNRVSAAECAAAWCAAWRAANPRLSDIHPATYLNNKRWEDETPAQPALRVISGHSNERSQFDTAHREYTRRLRAGEIHRGPDPSDPFAR